MDGPDIVARTISNTTIPDKYGNSWQYNSRSDRHSKVACWAVLFEMLERSGMLRSHVTTGKVVFGVNHEMRDFSTGRKKDLDLVLARPASPPSSDSPTLADLAERWQVTLTGGQRARLAGLPVALQGPVGSVLVALEAKACMTAHIKALPRLYDELSSSHLTVHGASEQALAGGFVMINASPDFRSSDLNRRNVATEGALISMHSQPYWAERTVAKIAELPRRSRTGQNGFDAIGVVVVRMRNDGSRVEAVNGPPGPPTGHVLHYESLVNRLVHQYDVTFAHI